MNDAQTWTVIAGLLAGMVALIGITTRFMSTNLSYAVDTLRAEIQSMGHQLGGRIDAQGRELRTEMTERFAQVDTRFAQVDQRFDSLDRRIDGIDADVQALTRRFLGGGGAA